MSNEIPAAVTTETVLATDTYLGHDITVVAIRRQQAEYTVTGTFRSGEDWSRFSPATDRTEIVGRISGYRNGVRVTGKQHDHYRAVLKACHKVLDQAAFDDSIRADVTSLVHAVKRSVDVTEFASEEPVHLEDEAYVYAMGYWRRGRVTKVSRNGKATVSYTTATSDGRIFHKTSNDVVKAR